jgi:protein-tyrosine-phosphatase
MDEDRSLRRRATTHAALGDPHRLAVVDALALSDCSPSHLARELGIETNLLAHHLDILEGAGLIERVASSGDRRRRYVRLRAAALAALAAAPALTARRVLFVCTGNSARSQLAAALWNVASPARAESAGTHPASRVHPRAVATAARHGLDLSAARPRGIAEVTDAPDLVVSVCDRAHEELAAWPDATRLHWSVPDPVRTGTAAAFERTFATLRTRVATLGPLVAAPGAAPA